MNIQDDLHRICYDEDGGVGGDLRGNEIARDACLRNKLGKGEDDKLG